MKGHSTMSSVIARHIRTNAVAWVALLVALGGTSYAAVTITGANIVNGSVTGIDVKNRSLLAADFKAGQLPAGAQGPAGAAGAPGTAGTLGAAGATGTSGTNGTNGTNGAPGTNGAAGTNGTDAVVDFALFYALMPFDNSATVGAGSHLQLPQDGPTSGGGITRTNASASEFTLAAIGTYEVAFQVSVDQPGQLVIALNGDDVAATVVGRAVGTTQIVGHTLVETTIANTVLTLGNPGGNSPALTITPIAGGTKPVSATLLIKRLA